MVKLKLYFSGGIEGLFKGVKNHEIDISESVTIQTIVPWIQANLLSGDEKHEFCVDGKIRPGIIFLVNDADWALFDATTPLQEGDEISFISTIHGG
ncbi:putative ubiquitin related modifier 1 [Monocercomonoides exilis]|uniref:putative ubiquitin related modifier 1 n=1 Tax=Monocercomonoides exilis TaxID=2049356 RepID=UPI00355AA934|nr:putative ubiquitin related modifier 1 [Monocercomonoides exilis]|eukprot:MONOS_769.1-p1 / transcript=MONOS_769.1 / gene=MONOS_769 / organism=Monocercomonoides_exilis_PA203 / gene_product=unspecified product / transcript_product=unspecified product / location=Mono_scaffold00013:55965-56386(-) / protein_length=95 / sequence_SO=supercontig / SO=protein_coding / is_pseudo=false